ncbi:MAG: molecular chaperone [Halodesulfurarchaeum sp.]
MSTTRTTDALEDVDDDIAEAAVFRVLGTLYLDPPDEILIEEVTRWADRWLAMDPPPELADPLAEIAAVDIGEEERLNEAFTYLFRGVVPDSPRPPYESLYRDGALYGPTAVEVERRYRESGIDVASESGELADHLGIELHYLAALRERGDVEAVESFVEDHVFEFFDRFESAIDAEDPPPFYRGAIDLTGVVLQSWRDA